jgi:hypothetical protein
MMIISSDENSKQDVMDPQRGKKTRFAKEHI